jgi:hypothetical protein
MTDQPETGKADRPVCKRILSFHLSTLNDKKIIEIEGYRDMVHYCIVPAKYSDVEIFDLLVCVLALRDPIYGGMEEIKMDSPNTSDISQGSVNITSKPGKVEYL